MNAGRPWASSSGLLRAPGRRRALNGKSGIYDTLRAMPGAPERRRHRVSFSRIRAQERIVRSDDGRGLGPGLLHELSTPRPTWSSRAAPGAAQHGILRVDHPDIMEFVTCRTTRPRSPISTSRSPSPTTSWPRSRPKHVRPAPPEDRQGRRAASMRARLGEIIHGAWKTASQACFFVDKANYYNPVPHLGAYEATTLRWSSPPAYDVCNLGRSISAAFVKEERSTGNHLRMVVHLSTHFLENVDRREPVSLPEITELAQRIRRIGLGVMGLADCSSSSGIPYDSEEGVALGRRIHSSWTRGPRSRASASPGTEALSRVGAEHLGARTRPPLAAQGRAGRPMRRLRNCNVTTVHRPAPSRSSPAAASGIEPLFAVAFMRNQAGVLHCPTSTRTSSPSRRPRAGIPRT